MDDKKFIKSDLKSRMKKLVLQESLSDVTFLVGDPPQRVPCHKLILATGSKVFEAMLYGKMANGEEISIPDVTYAGFSIMLRYLYTDAINIENESDAVEAAYVAKKYLLKDLFQACESYLLLQGTINMKTVFSLYEEAAFLEMKKLQKRCLWYISRNANDLFGSESFFATSEDTLRDILKLDLLHVDSEKVVIEAIWNWGKERCQEHGMQCNSENVRNSTKDLLKYIRFLSLCSDELENVFQKYQLFDESEQLAVLWNSSMPKVERTSKMPPNLCEVSRSRSISNSYRLNLPTKYRYDGNMTNFSVSKFKQHIDINTKGSSVTIIGVIVAFKPINCYSSLHRQLNIDLVVQNKTTNFRTETKSSHTASEQNGDHEIEREILLDDYMTLADGDVGLIIFEFEAEGVRIMECSKEQFESEIADTHVTFSFKRDEDRTRMMCPIKEIMCIRS